MKSSSMLAIAWCLWAGAAQAAEPAPAAGNVTIAGPKVEIGQPVQGDVLAAAGRIRIVQPVAQDAALAAGDIEVRARIGQDLRAAAGNLTIAAPIGGDAHLVGGSVHLERGSEIAGPSWIAGGEVQLLGVLGGRTKIYAGSVVIDGIVHGDLQVTAKDIELRPGAQIAGTLRYTSPNELRMAPGAKVAGAIERQPTRSREHAPRASGPFGIVFGIVLWLLSLFAAGVVWLLLFPRYAGDAQAQLQKAPAASVGVGFLVLVAMPVAVALLAITIVGLPLALTLLAAYGLVLLAGYLVVATTLADRLLIAAGQPSPTRGWRFASLAIALLLLLLVGAIPVLGWLIALGVLMAGSGALVRQRFRPVAA
jgi:hypothetical protein